MAIDVQFTDLSTAGPSGPITGWAWNFGDGGTSTDQNPAHSYATAGSQTATLTVTSPDGTSTTTHTFTLTDPGALTATFGVATSGLTVTLTDTSNPGPSGPITGWAWNFGDAATSTSQNPTHTYAAAGTYTITLTVTGTSPDGTDNTTHTATVATTPAPGPKPVVISTLLFSDEFNGAAGSKPDSAKWGAKTTVGGSGCHFDGTNQIELDGAGNVVITAALSGGVWHSGWLSASKTGDGYNGSRYVEARAKVADGNGTWSSPIWEWSYPFGAGGVEIDVIERLGKTPDQYHATIHNWTVSPNRESGGLITGAADLGLAFHIYGCAIYPDHADFYLDGVKKATRLASAIGLASLTTFTSCMNCSLNMGGWAGTPTIPGPVSMLVDYIHVYRIP